MSFWRLWVEGDQVRLAADFEIGGVFKPAHLEEVGGTLAWAPHPEGTQIPSVPLPSFTAWLEEGAAATPPDLPA